MLFQRLQRYVGRIIALLFLAYMSSFTVLKPILIFYFDLYLPYSTNSESAIAALLAGSLVFLIIEYIAIRIFINHRSKVPLLAVFDFAKAKPSAMWLTFICFMIISFVGSSIKFSDPGYLFTSTSTFDATMAQAGGSYYINYLAESLYFGMVVVLAFYSDKLSKIKFFLLLLILVVLTFFWAKMAARTGIMVIFVAWLACALSIQKQRALNMFYIAAFGYFLLILLYVGNFIRLGNIDAIDPNRAIFGAIVAASSDLGPVDNAALLYGTMHQYQNTSFIQLMGAVTPMVLVPSSIFPLKLPADKDSELTRIFFPGGADTTFYHQGSTLTFTIPGSGYADAGYFGVVVSSLIYALILCFYIRQYRGGSTSTKFVAAVFMIIHIIGFRLSVEALLQTFYTGLLLVGIAKLFATIFSSLRVRQCQSNTRYLPIQRI